MTRRIAAVAGFAAILVMLAACQAPITPTAVPAPQKLDCNLIFPAPSRDTLTP